MQTKGFIRVLTYALILICLFYLSFTFVSNHYQNKAEQKALAAAGIKSADTSNKSSTMLGHAVWVKDNCVVLTDGVNCGNCARHCPVGAIMMVPSNADDESSPMVPAVNISMCIGCGTCEYVCPARPFSAIYVEGHEVHNQI